MSIADTTRTVVTKLVAFGLTKLVPVVEHVLPPPVELLVAGILALPAVQSEQEKVAELCGDEAAKAESYLQGKLEGLVDSELKAHPAVAAWVAAVKSSGIAVQVVSEVEKTFGPRITQALKDLDKKGMIGDLETFLHQAGVL